MFLSKYGVARHIYIAIPKAGSADHAASADWTPSAGDVKISKDGGAAANVTNLPTAIAMGNSTIWDFSLTATEMQAAQVMVTVSDSATKAVDDTGFIIETYGNASAQHAVDLDDGVRAGLTALPNAAADAAGGLPISDAGGLDLDTLNTNVSSILDDTGTSGVVVATSNRPKIRKNTALSAFPFLMTDDTNHNPATGLTVSATRSLDGAAFASCTNSVVEVSNGWYTIDLAAGDLNGDTVALRFTATGADDLDITVITNP